jgi:DNA-binding LacI/PurR family transcriptional regulator
VPSGAPTVYDVAERAGVSIATVSRVMRGSDRVAPGIRDRVLAAADELGYRPNTLARSLAESGGDALGVMLPSDVSHPFYALLAERLVQAARSHGYDIIVGLSPTNDVADYVAAASQLEDRRTAGMLLCGTRGAVQAYWAGRRAGAPPAVAVGGRPVGDIPIVSVDEEAAGYAATRYLADLGHRWIGHLGYSQSQVRQDGREHGYLRAMSDAGLEPVFHGEVLGMEHARPGVQAMLAAHPDLTAVVSVNDAVAIGALRGLVDRGLRVPHDVSLTGFDNIPQSLYAVPSLTTIEVPVEEVAQLAVRMLAELMDSGKSSSVSERVLLPPKLIVRESTGPHTGDG